MYDKAGHLSKVVFGQESPDNGISKIPKHVEIGMNDGILICFKRF